MDDKQKAIYYAKRRVEQSELMVAEIKSKYINAFKRVCTFSYQSGVSPSYFEFSKYFGINNFVNNTVDTLVKDLYDIMEKYAIRDAALAKFKNDREDDIDDDIIAYINRPIFGQDLNGRLAEDSEKATLEFEAYVAAGLLLRRPINAVLSDFRAFLSNPYSSPLLREVVRLDKAEIAAKRLLSKGITFGVGKYVSTYNSLKRLGEATGNYAYNFADDNYMARNGAVGYTVYRGSAYPCSACDSNTGYHPLGDYALPVHPACLCYAVPVFI